MANSKVHRWGTAESLINHMDRHGIRSSFVTGFAFRDQGLCRSMNDYVLDSASKYSGRIIPLAVVSPCAKGAAEEILRCAERGAAGLGELFPDGQELDISDAGQTWRMVGACLEAGMFIMFHTAEQVGHQYAGKGRTGPAEAAAFCINHPQARVVFAHFGGGLWAYESMPEMKPAEYIVRECEDPSMLELMRLAFRANKVMGWREKNLEEAAKNQVVIENDGVSREHAWVGSENGRMMVKDLNSLNGTYLNSTESDRIKSEALKDGDMIILGKGRFAAFTYRAG